MPSDEDFRAFEAQVREGQYKIEDINRHWPAEADQKAYHAWWDARKARRTAFMKTTFTHLDFVQHVDGMDFASDRVEEKLLPMLLRGEPPTVSLGKDATGTLYRLVPDDLNMIPDCDYEDTSASSSDVDYDEEVASRRVQQRRRPLSTLGLNTRSASGSDYAHGFYFPQLGILESSTPDNSNGGGGSHTWSETGFNLVARLSPNNRGPATAFCAVFNAHPYHPIYGERYETAKKTGCLPLHHGATSCSFATLGGIAGLADCAEDFSTSLSWVEPSCAEPVEIVPAERGLDGYIVGTSAGVRDGE